jgi:hypothetical protein
MQARIPHTKIDRAPPHPELEELTPRHAPMLAFSELSDRQVARATSAFTVMADVARGRHEATVAAETARRVRGV